MIFEQNFLKYPSLLELSRGVLNGRYFCGVAIFPCPEHDVAELYLIKVSILVLAPEGHHFCNEAKRTRDIL